MGKRMAGTIQIRLKKNEIWMKEAIQELSASQDMRFHDRSESQICKMLLEEILKQEIGKVREEG